MRRATFVSAGLLKPKKQTAFAGKHLYLNFGLLSLATRLSVDGWDTRLFHGGFTVPEQVARTVARELAGASSCPVFLSIPSFLAVPWARLFSVELRRLMPEAPLIVGGRWVVAAGENWIRSRIPEASLVVFGTAENRIALIANCANWHLISGTDMNRAAPGVAPPDSPGDLNYELVEDYRAYQPSIEVSRGCTMACRFCPETGRGAVGMRNPNLVIRSLDLAATTYGTEQISPYFEASLFAPTDSWVNDFRQVYAPAGHRIQWRCESRVDVITPDQLGKPAAAGLRVLDLGLESASLSQLAAMGKTRNAQRYLSRASELLKACVNLGVWAKVNILLYAGESRRTIAETTDWLELHRGCIKGLSVGPVAVYGPTVLSHQFVTELRRHGASVVDTSSLERFGFSAVHLSAALDHDSAVEISGAISRSFMGARDYFDLKSFSYFPRQYTYSEFKAEACTADQNGLPVSLAGICEEHPKAGGNLSSSGIG